MLNTSSKWRSTILTHLKNGKWESIGSLILLMNNSFQLTLEKLAVFLSLSSMNLLTRDLPKRLTGEQRVWLLLLRIKDNVDLAGLLLLLLLMKAIKFNSKTNLWQSALVNNNLSIAPLAHLTSMKVVMEVTVLELLNGSRIMDRPLQLNILTKLSTKHALATQDHTKSSELLRLQDAKKSRKWSRDVLWLLELMQATGICTRVVFSITALKILTTLCSSLVHPKLHGLSRTVGQLLGERVDTSD